MNRYNTYDIHDWNIYGWPGEFVYGDDMYIDDYYMEERWLPISGLWILLICSVAFLSFLF